MVRKNVLLGVVVSFVIILLVIALVKMVVPSALDGFADLDCYGVKCGEGQFCQEKVCRDINPKYTNNYYNEGVESFTCAEKNKQ